MATATARRHVEDAIRRRLRIRVSEIRDEMTSIRNANVLDSVDRDMRGAVCVVCSNGWIEIHVPGADGLHDFALSLHLPKPCFARWERMSLEEAHALPNGVVLGTDAEPIALPLAA